jgi:hypothetical protein
MTHYAYHVGQIVYLAKHWKGADWKSLSVSKGQSEQYNAELLRKRQKQLGARCDSGACRV